MRRTRAPQGSGGKRKPTARASGKNLTVSPYQIADSLSVKLRYPIAGNLSGAVIVKSVRWTPNGAYDIDPTLGSTSTPGFAEYAALYTYYRVERYDIDVTCSNLDNLDIALYWVNSNVDPGVTGTSFFDYASNAHCGTRGLAPFYSGAGTHRIRQSISVRSILGMNTGQADSFRSLVGAVPADLVWFGLGIRSTSGVNFTSGVSYVGTITPHVRFYARVALETTFFDPAELQAQRILFKEQRAIQVERASNLLFEQRKTRIEKFEKRVAAALSDLRESSVAEFSATREMAQTPILKGGSRIENTEVSSGCAGAGESHLSPMELITTQTPVATTTSTLKDVPAADEANREARESLGELDFQKRLDALRLLLKTPDL